MSRLNCGLLLLCVLLLAGGCPRPQTTASDKPAGSTADGKVPEALTIAYSGNFRGFQRPCGCTDRQDGGLPRLATALSAVQRALGGEAPDTVLPPALSMPQLAPQPLVLIDCGNYASLTERQSGLRARTHLEALAQLGAKAAVLGSEETALPAEEATAALVDSPVPLVSCNVELTLEGLKVQPSAPLAPGWHVIGLTAPPADGKGPGWVRVNDPLAGARTALAALPRDSRVVIAAAQLPPALAQQLAALPGVSAVIGHDPKDGDWPNSLALALPPPVWRAQQLTFASLGAEPRAWSLELSDRWADDQQQLQILLAGNDARRKQAASDPNQWRKTSWTMTERFLPREPDAPPPPEETYAGAQSCQSCHAEAYAKWDKTHHHEAYQSLLAHNEAQTLDCLQCHTTGQLQPGGYNPDKSYDVLRDDKARVGCESCHGPGQAHVQLATAGKLPRSGGVEQMKITRGDLKGCVSCHDPYNSPDFEPQHYWEQIKH